MILGIYIKTGKHMRNDIYYSEADSSHLIWLPAFEKIFLQMTLFFYMDVTFHCAYSLIFSLSIPVFWTLRLNNTFTLGIGMPWSFGAGAWNYCEDLLDSRMQQIMQSFWQQYFILYQFDSFTS